MKATLMEIMEIIGANVRKDNKIEKGRNGPRNIRDSGICCRWHFWLGPATGIPTLHCILKSIPGQQSTGNTRWKKQIGRNNPSMGENIPSTTSKGKAGKVLNFI